MDETHDDPYEERPTQRAEGGDDGLWDALDANGHGHTLGYRSRELVEAWLAGYRVGAAENM
jgi:hypothetical protein